ncbi:MAG: CpsB/CapC family capsule biosynthesis tyrosine phosphatase [Anaerovoracaceae bacterium]
MKMIDWHTHILPSMDDGSKSVEESAAMLELCRNMGVATVVLTPHFYPHKEDPERFLERRSRSLERLNKHLKETGNPAEFSASKPKLIPGAEVYYFPELAVMEEERLRKLCIGDSHYIMVELPVESWNDEIYSTLESMIFNRRIIPVLAHIDRYFHFIKDTARLGELIKMGMLVQLNVEALTGFFSRRKALKWIDKEMVHILASDCHNLTERPPNLDKGLQILQSHINDSTINKLMAVEP